MPDTTRAARLVGAGLGLLLVAAALALSLPGVKAVRADDAEAPLVSEAPAGQTCNAADPDRTAAATIGRMAAELEQVRAAAPAASQGSDVVVLNNRGYNYTSAPSPEQIEQIRRALAARAGR